MHCSPLKVSFRKRTLQLVALSRKETCNLMALSRKETCNLMALSRKETCNLMALSRKDTCNLRHPMHFRRSILRDIIRDETYEVASMSRLLKFIRLFGKTTL